MNEATRSYPADDHTSTDHSVAESFHWPAHAIPGYELLGEVGRGGMGVVYRAREHAMGREVAVKILQRKFAPDSTTAARFLEEARITGQLQHPGIPAVYQVGRLADERPYLAMKLIKGRTLDGLLKEAHPLDPLGVFEAICQAVGYAHAHGVIHRDLKPHNVMVGAFGEVQVMDWGLAKLISDSQSVQSTGRAADLTTAATEIKSARDSDTPFTQFGSALGTPAYMPPEQAAGELAKVDRRSDVFGLGAILCVLITGKPPFTGRDAESVRLAAVRGQTEDALASLDASGVDLGVIDLCKRCLAFEPEARPSSANEVARIVADLRRAAEDRVRIAEREKHAAEVREGEQSKRRRTIQRASFVLVTVLLVGIAGTTLGLLRADEARRQAEIAERTAEERRADADLARKAEAEQREKAERKEAEASAVLRFLEDRIFNAAGEKNPVDLKKNVTLGDVLLASLPHLNDYLKDPLIEARLRMTLGRGFGSTSEYKDAAEQFERALEIRTRVLGAEDPETLISKRNLGRVLLKLDRVSEAIPLLNAFITQYRPDSFSWIAIRSAMIEQVEYFQKFPNPARCRSVAEVWESIDYGEKYNQYYDAGCLRAIAAGQYAKANQPAEATADADRAVVLLKKSIELGFEDVQNMQTDQDLDFLRDREDFKRLLAELKKRFPQPGEAGPRPRVVK